MASTIYVCGTPSKKRPTIRGPPNVRHAVLINAKQLPNPYHKVRHEPEETRLEKTEEVLRSTSSAKFDALVLKGVKAVSAGHPVVVQCMFGRDRSHVVGRAIQRKCGDVGVSLVLVEQ